MYSSQYTRLKLELLFVSLSQIHSNGMHFFTKSYFLFSILCIINGFVVAQSTDSLNRRPSRDSTIVSFFNNDFEKLGLLKLHPNDTALNGFQNYDPLYKHSPFYATLGNIGQSSLSLVPSPFQQKSGFDYGVHTLDAYLYQNDSVKYYKVFKTYTELWYVQGAKKEQNFHAIFSRNLYRSLNLGFDFRVMSAPGAYQRQKANHINFVLTTQFITKNKRYGVIANFLINRIKNNENGGIKYDSLFEQNLETNRQILAVNLQKAQTRVRENGFYMKHYFDLTRHPRNENDTTLGTKKRIELGRLTYSFQYNRQIQNYIDGQANSGFYENIFLDSLTSVDSVTITKIVNEVIWSNPSFNKEKKYRVIQLEAGFRQQYIELSLHEIKQYFIQWIPEVTFSFQPVSSLRLVARGEYVFGDYNESDLSLRIRLSQILGRTTKNLGIITLTGDYALQKPGWFYEHYYSNNFIWDTVWEKQGLISAGLNYSLKFLEAGFTVNRISNYVYLDSSATPKQFKGGFGHLYAYLNTHLDLWRFNVTAKLIYQTIQGTNVLRVPAFMGNLSLYYSQPLFHGVAILQPGLSFYYNTPYYADSYMPATHSFYIQDRKEIGNYIYMDVFINLKIQRARFFVMYSHFNASFMEKYYYTVPDYPMPDGAFKFGISWRFHD